MSLHAAAAKSASKGPRTPKGPWCPRCRATGKHLETTGVHEAIASLAVHLSEKRRVFRGELRCIPCKRPFFSSHPKAKPKEAPWTARSRISGCGFCGGEMGLNDLPIHCCPLAIESEHCLWCGDDLVATKAFCSPHCSAEYHQDMTTSIRKTGF